MRTEKGTWNNQKKSNSIQVTTVVKLRLEIESFIPLLLTLDFLNIKDRDISQEVIHYLSFQIQNYFIHFEYFFLKIMITV